MKQTHNFIGQTNINSKGFKMTIISYQGYRNIIVQFEDGSTTRTSINHWKEGNVTHPKYGKMYHNIGYVDYTIEDISTVKLEPSYNMWRGMIDRCYGNHKGNNKVYIGCSVDSEWHNYTNFKQWYNKNFYQIPGEKMELDKDIKIMGNKIYSTNTCLIVPSYINCWFVKHRTNELAQGVSWHPPGNKHYRVTALPKHQLYETLEEASEAFQNYKQQVIQKYLIKNEEYFPKEVYLILLQKVQNKEW